LLIEVDGLAAGLDQDAERIDRLCREHGARGVRIAADEAERTRLWQGRKKAFGAMGRIAPHLFVQDAVVPRTRLPAIMAGIARIAAEQRVNVCNVFHAGDGNLHPTIAYNAHDADESQRVAEAMRGIMQLCVDAGGSVTGEHGIGIDKLEYMPLIFHEDSLAAMCRLREVFDPGRRSNPGKVVPVHSCREWAGTPAARKVAS
jgi:FAD/FMN-containing dehydrogenase